MPQQFRVLRCFKCRFFQVDIVKIAKKWSCKMCGEKQSVLVEIFRGAAPDCRRRVQAMNMDEKFEQQQGQLVGERILSGVIELAGRQCLETPEDEENNSPVARSKYDCFKDSEHPTDKFQSPDRFEGDYNTLSPLKQETPPDDEHVLESPAHKKLKLSENCYQVNHLNESIPEPQKSRSKWTQFLE